MGRMAPGGTEHQLVGMLAAAHQRHWQATLCVLSGRWELSKHLQAAEVPVVELNGAGRFDPRSLSRLRRLASDVDVVHASLPRTNVLSRFVNIGPHRPAMVISERGVEPEVSPRMALVNRLLNPMTDAYIGNSPAVVSHIRAAHGVADLDSRVVQIPNGIDTEIFHPGPRSALNGTSRLKLVAVGRLVASKRFDFAISLVSQLIGVSNVELSLVGDGPERDKLRKLAGGLPVKFLGHVADRKRLAEILRSSDVLLMPSTREGYPNVVLEAIACGLPAVASNIPGIRPASGPGVTLVGDDGPEWCQAVVSAWRQGPIAEPILTNRVLSFDEVARRHLLVFEKAVKRDRGHVRSV